MTQEFKISSVLLEPALLDGKEQDLIEVYVTLIVRKMEEWTANLMRTEVDDFLTRRASPDLDVDGQYGMQGAIILFQMLNQQIDLALDSNQGAILMRVVEELNRVTKSIQAQWIELLATELKRFMEKPDEMALGFVEYAMALANDQIKSADFTEALNSRLEPLVSSKYKSQISDRLNDTMDGYLDVAKKCVQVLIDVIFKKDLVASFKVLLTERWYSEDPMAAIIFTMRDYVDDYREHLNMNLFELLMEDMIDTFLIQYLVAIRKCSKLRIPQAVNRMREDKAQAFDFFVQFKSQRELEGYFDVLEAVLKLISSSKMMVYLDVRSLSYSLSFCASVGLTRFNLTCDSITLSDNVTVSISRMWKESCALETISINLLFRIFLTP